MLMLSSAEELLELFSDPANAVDSPDLGPPPVAHFEEGDPIKFDAGKRVEEPTPDIGEEIPQALSANLETRRKRRESSHSGDLGRAQKTEPSAAQRGNDLLTTSSAGSSQPLKSGAKRKLSVREDEEHTDALNPVEKEVFRFHRRNTPSSAPENPRTSASKLADLVSNKVTQDLAAARGTSRSTTRETACVTVTSTRPALGPSKRPSSRPFCRSRTDSIAESVNTDPVTSPVKASKPLDKAEIGDFKKHEPKKSRDRDRTRDRPPSVKPIPPLKKHQESIASILSPAESDSPPPETPAPLPLDLFSPLTSEPSAARPESRDTPPPPDLNPDASNSDAFNAAGRISRRARGSVSYAEPNLRDKMRRPTKDLVDAVGADERVSRAASAKPDGSKSENEDVNGVDRNKAMRTVVIKKEDVLSESASWKHLASVEPSKSQHEHARAEPTSPLGNKSSADLPASVITERRRRTSALHRSEGLPLREEKPSTSGSGTTIAALLAAGAGTKKSKNGPTATRNECEEQKQLDEPVDIYDFNDSTPTGQQIETIVLAKDRPVGPAATRTSRRQPSVLASSRSIASILTAPHGPEAKEGPLVARARGRRETLGSAASTALTAPMASATAEAKTKPDGHSDLPPAKSVLGLGAAFAEGGSGRAERAASRRRSMML